MRLTTSTKKYGKSYGGSTHEISAIKIMFHGTQFASPISDSFFISPFCLGINKSDSKETSMPATTDNPVKNFLVSLRPFAYTASALSVILGMALCYFDGFPIHWGLLGLTFFGVVCFQSAANLLNDSFDHRRGLDKEALPMSGAVVRGLITEKKAVQRGAMFLASGTAAGILLVAAAGWPILLPRAVWPYRYRWLYTVGVVLQIRCSGRHRHIPYFWRIARVWDLLGSDALLQLASGAVEPSAGFIYCRHFACQ